MKRKPAARIPAAAREDADAMPVALRRLLHAELAAGNTIVEVGHSFPAPPAGAYFKLAKPLLTRGKKLERGVVYYNRNNSIYSGEITDKKRFYFLLEPAGPPPPEPDMDAIRAELAQRVADRDAREMVEPRKSVPPRCDLQEITTPVAQFERSMVMDYDKWHDGIGYDLELLRKLSARDRGAVEAMLIRKGLNGWRDVEALAEIDSDASRAVLEAGVHHRSPEVRNAVLQYAPQVVSEAHKVRVLVQGLKSDVIFDGLTQTLDQVAGFHPPAVMEALFRGAVERSGDVAVHFAAMICHLHGKAPEPFDWAQRPFFLRFHTEVRSERVAVFRELCEKIGVTADSYLNPAG
ncbi:MAG: hypothetical protein ABIV50_05070 [Opitutus sp.]